MDSTPLDGQPPSNNKPKSAIESAIKWLDLGYWPIPISRASKLPTSKLITGGTGWPHWRLTKDNLTDYFSEDDNCGLLFGDEKNHTDVDCDCKEAIIAARILLPPTGITYGRESKRASHYLYIANSVVYTKQFKDPSDQKMIIELRGRTQNQTCSQSVAPYSVHSSGEIVEFEKGSTGIPGTYPAEFLQRLVSHAAAASIFAKHWPAVGEGRHRCELSLGGVLARGGMNVDDAVLFVDTMYKATGTGSLTAEMAVRDSFNKYANDQKFTGLKTLLEFIDASVVYKALEWMDIALGDEIVDIDSLPWIGDISTSQIVYAVEGFSVDKSVTAVSGISGDGKTTFVLAVALAHAAGSDLAGRKVLKLPVLYVDKENPAAIFLDKLRKLGVTARPENFYTWSGCHEYEPEGPTSKAISNWLDAHPGGVIVFDSYISFHPGSENSADETRRYMDGFRALAHRGANSYLLDHASEKTGTAVNYRGSSDFQAGLDSAWLATNTYEGDQRKLQTLDFTPWKTRGAPLEKFSLEYNDSGDVHYFTVVDPNSPESKRRRVQQTLMGILKNQPGITSKEFETAGVKSVGRPATQQFLADGIAEGSIRVEISTDSSHSKRHFWVDPSKRVGQQAIELPKDHQDLKF